MVKQINVKWRQPSFAYAQLIPHATVNTRLVYTAKHKEPIDIQPQESRRRQHQPPVSPPRRHRDEPEPPSPPTTPPASPPPPLPLFSWPYPSSPHRSGLRVAAKRVASLDRQLQELNAETERSTVKHRRLSSQRRDVAAALARRDVLSARHSLCTSPPAVQSTVSALLGPDAQRVSRLYAAAHPRAPAQEPHEVKATVEERNRMVATAPFVFGSSAGRWGERKTEEEKEAEEKEERREQEPQPAGLQQQRPVSAMPRRAASHKDSRQSPFTTAATQRRQQSASDKVGTPGRLSERPVSSGISQSPQRPKSSSRPVAPPSRQQAVSLPVSASSAALRSPSPPPPSPPPAHRPPFLTWRTGPRHDTNRPSSASSPVSGRVLTIGKARWGEVVVRGEVVGKGRVRQRRVEEDWERRERERRERRRRSLLMEKGLEEGAGVRVRELEAAIQRERSKERQLRSQQREEERRLEQARRQQWSSRRTADRKEESRDGSAAEYEAVYEHPFLHPSLLSSSLSSRPAAQSSRAAPSSPLLPQARLQRRVSFPLPSAASVVSPPRASSSHGVRVAAGGREERRQSLPGFELKRREDELVEGKAAVAAMRVEEEIREEEKGGVLPSQAAAAVSSTEEELMRYIVSYEQQLEQEVRQLHREEKEIRGRLAAGGSEELKSSDALLRVARSRRQVGEKRVELVQLRRRLEELREERQKARRQRPQPKQTLRATSPPPPPPAHIPSRSSQSTATLPARVSVVPEAAAAESEKATQTSAVFVAVSVREEEAVSQTAELSVSSSGGSEDAERRELELSVERDMADVIRMLRLRLEQPPQPQPPPASAQTETETVEAKEQHEKEEEEEEAVEHQHEHRYVASAVAAAPAASSLLSPASFSSLAPAVAAATEAAEDSADMLRRHHLTLAAIRQRAPRIRQRLTDMVSQQQSSRL